MWARVIDIMLAGWLAASPFIFRHTPDEVFLWVTDLSCAVAITLFSLLSYRRVRKGSPAGAVVAPRRGGFDPRWEKLHLLNLAVAGWLIGTGFIAAGSPPPPAIQNHVVIGLLLLMFAIIPSHAELPPRSWREFYQNRE